MSVALFWSTIRVATSYKLSMPYLIIAACSRSLLWVPGVCAKHAGSSS